MESLDLLRAVDLLAQAALILTDKFAASSQREYLVLTKLCTHLGEQILALQKAESEQVRRALKSQ